MEKDYYEILGVPSDANANLIKSVYRSLSQIYHPDKYVGDKKYAENKMREINEAYSVLSNPTKRKDYDKTYKSKNKYEFDKGESEDEENFHKTVKSDWEILTDYYPDIEAERKHLLTIHKRLAVNFQINIIVEKNTKNWKKISTNVVNEYFNRYFGNNKKLHRFVEFVLIERNLKVANDINKAVKVLGDGDVEVIINKIRNKYSKQLKFISEGTFEHWQAYFYNFNYKDFSERAEFFSWLSYENRSNESQNIKPDIERNEELFLMTLFKVGALFIFIAIFLTFIFASI